MKGADQIIKMRLSGRKPPVINIWDYDINLPFEDYEVLVYKIPTSKLDLRFVVDCLVTIASENRSEELHQMCLDCGARQVVSGTWIKHYY